MKKYFIEFIIGIVLFATGCGYITFEVLSYDYQNEMLANIKQKEESLFFELDGEKQYKVKSEYGKVEMIYQEEYQDHFKIEIIYPEEYLTLDYFNRTIGTKNEINITFNEEFNNENFKNALDLVIDDFKNKTFHNYKKTFEPKIKIYVNENMAKYIKIESYWEEEKF